MPKVLFTGLFVDSEKLQRMFEPVYENIYYDHVTLQFKPRSIKHLLIGKELDIVVVGRLITDKVDVLICDEPKRNSHITLSTAEGVKPIESNTEIANYPEAIISLHFTIKGTVGYRDTENNTVIRNNNS